MLSKKEFITCLDWANVRWPNLDLSKDSVASLYDDYKNFSYSSLFKALNLIYKNGDNFLSLPKLYKLTSDLYNDEFIVKALPSPKEKNGLKKYLKENNFKNLKDAIRYNNRRS